MNGSNRKSRRKINAVDIMIIILVLALIGTGVYRIYAEITKNVLSKKSDITISFECDVTYPNILKYLNDGDAVYFSSDGSLLGYLYDRSDDGIEGAVYEIKDINSDNEDESINQGYGGKNIKIGGTLKLNDDVIKPKNVGYYVLNGNTITVGSTIEVYTEEAIMKLVVKSINEPK